MVGEFGGRAEAGPVVVGWVVPGDVDPGLRLGTIDDRRLAGFPRDRRRAFVTGRALVARLLAARFGEGGLVDTAPCPHCGGDHGPIRVEGVPALAGVAYSGGLVVVAVAPDGEAHRLGVDVEVATLDPVRDADLGRLLEVAPSRALRRWTEVEAVLKAAGRGLRTDPGHVRFDAGTARVDGAPGIYRVEQVIGPPGYEVSVAWQPAET